MPGTNSRQLLPALAFASFDAELANPGNVDELG